MGNMGESFFQRNGLNKPIFLRMSERFVYVKNRYILRLIILINRLQTGDVAQKRGSRQTTENDHPMLAFESLLKGKFLTRLIVSDNVR